MFRTKEAGEGESLELRMRVRRTLDGFDICLDDLIGRAVDNQHKLKDAFLNEQGWVPVYYLFDAEGKLKTRAAGEFGIDELESR